MRSLRFLLTTLALAACPALLATDLAPGHGVVISEVPYNPCEFASSATAHLFITSALTRRFGERLAVDSVDIRIEHGVFLGLIGSNGAGKTTLIKMLTTLLPPTSGSARVAGFDVVREARQVRRRIGYVPQLISADAALSGRENLSLFAKLYGVARSEGAGRIDEGLAFMGLADELLVADASWGLVFAARDVSHTDRAPANHRHLLGD